MKKFSNVVFCAAVLLNSAVFANSPTNTRFSPYADITLNTHWDATTQTLEPMDLAPIATSNGLSALHLAFITDSGSCQPAWGAQASYSLSSQWGKHMTDKLAQNGVEINVSFGGASGNDISLNCDKNQLLSIFADTMNTYKASALDFDIENGTANVQKLIAALQVFQQQHPKIRLSFTLPVMPDGLTWLGKDVISSAQKAGLQFQINIMAMDYSPDMKGNMADYAIQAANALHDYLTTLYSNKSATELWQMIEVTPMIGVNDVAVEQFTLNDAATMKKFASSKQMGGLSMWSLSRDKPCADQWASSTCSGNNLQTSDYQFVKNFVGK